MGSYEKTGAVVQLTAAMALAGSSVVVGKVLSSALPVFLTTFASLLVAFLVMLPLVRQRRGEILLLTRREWCYLFLQGICGIVLFRIFLLFGLRHMGAAGAGVITGAAPAVLTLLAWLMLGERPGMRGAAGIICAVLGGMAISIQGIGDETGNRLTGSLFVFCAVVCEGLFSIFRKRVAATVSAVVNTAALIFCALLASLPLAIHDAVGLSAPPSPAALAAILYYGAVATVLAYILWTGGVGKVSGAIAGVTCAAMPASAVLLSAALLGEPLNASHLVGCGLVAAGIVVASLPPQEDQGREPTDSCHIDRG